MYERPATASGLPIAKLAVYIVCLRWAANRKHTGLMFRRIFSFAICCLLAAGCTSIKQGVVGTTRAEISPFAQEAINTLSVESMEIRRNRLTRLREYFDDDTAEVNELAAVIERVEVFRKSIALYSLELVHIAGLTLEPAEKSQQLASYLRSEFAARVIDTLGMPQEQFSTIVDNIGQQTRFLDAIKAVQPLITEAANFHELLLRQLETDRLPAVVEYFDVAIEEDFAAVLQQEDTLEVRRDQLMQALQLLDQAMSGDSSVWAQLHELPAFRLDTSRPPLRPDEQALLRSEAYLIAELRKNAEILELIGPSLRTYAEARAELDNLASVISSGIKVARFQLAAWRKAHEDLGNGVRDPGRWLSTAFSVTRAI